MLRGCRKLVGALSVLLLLTSSVAAAPRYKEKRGTATTTNTAWTSTFNPRYVTVCNDGPTNTLYFDVTDGVATTADDSTNGSLLPTECETLTLSDPNVNNTFAVGVITSASTTLYRIKVWR